MRRKAAFSVVLTRRPEIMQPLKVVLVYGTKQYEETFYNSQDLLNQIKTSIEREDFVSMNLEAMG